jgi:glucose-1-phosphate thymidylyltransferase
MKGILLAGGTGSRLSPLTKVTNKHLLPVYDKVMIQLPLQTLINSGLKEIMIVSSKEHSGDIIELLGSGKEFGVKLYYGVQDEAGGIAQAIGICREFIGKDNMAVILGDNIFQEYFFTKCYSFISGCRIFLKKVKNPSRYGVAEIKKKEIIKIEEKPKHPKSNYAVTGFYLYDGQIFDIINRLKPSKRGELEITDVNNEYIKQGRMKYSIVECFWSDAGTFESLRQSSEFVRRSIKEWSDKNVMDGNSG